MFKMYEGEVLKKFPVVQHMMFGTLFSFERSETVRETEDVQVPNVESGEPLRMPRQHGMFAFRVRNEHVRSEIEKSFRFLR